MSGVAVVTDSTASFPPGLAEQHGLYVVPLHVVLGHRAGPEGVEVSPADVALAFADRRVRVTTSRPTPGQLLSTYRRCGSERVVSVHLSGALSGTLDSARSAAVKAAAEGIDVRVVDSRSLAMGLGFAALVAAREAAAGASVDAVEAAAAGCDTSTLFYVDTLEHLWRGGRTTAAAALIGTALSVKPLLVVRDGGIHLLDKVRTASKALARLRQLVVDQATGPVDLAVHHLAAPQRAAALAEALRRDLPEVQTIHVSEVGAVIGAHAGPGLVGVVVCRG